jgi:hypothetical protein
MKWAAASIGVSFKLARRWRDQGQVDDSMETDSCYRLFYTELEKAESELEQRMVSKWTAALESKEDGWKGIMQFLEKRFRDEWGKAPVEINASVIDIRKSPEFKTLVAMILQTVPADKQVELSEYLDKLAVNDEE